MSRIERINQQMKREISLIVQKDLQDPRAEFISITKADVSKDLRHARIYFSAFGETDQETVLKTLNKARGLIRKLVGQRMPMRYVPELDFYQDKSIEYSSQIEQTLSEIHDEDNETS